MRRAVCALSLACAVLFVGLASGARRLDVAGQPHTHLVKEQQEGVQQAHQLQGAILNGRPIIGILSQPGDVVQGDKTYFSAGYVKWLESAGARVVPIQPDLSHKELKKRFGIINGLLFPGGNYPLKTTTQWFRAAKFLLELAKDANDNGVHFPVLGTCLGLQLLVTLVTNDEYAISSVDAHNHPSRLTFTGNGQVSSFLKDLPKDVINNFEQQPIAFHNHHYGLYPQALMDYPELGKFYRIVATTQDRDGVQYASILEAKEYPFFGLAFHSEKIAFEWTTQLDLPRSRVAMDAAYNVAQAFVEQARRNTHRGASIVEEDEYAIYNWEAQFIGKHKSAEDETFFEQVYVFQPSA